MCVQKQNTKYKSLPLPREAYPKITPADDSCVCGPCVCTVTAMWTDGYEGLLFKAGAAAPQFSTEQMG